MEVKCRHKKSAVANCDEHVFGCVRAINLRFQLLISHSTMRQTKKKTNKINRLVLPLQLSEASKNKHAKEIERGRENKKTIAHDSQYAIENRFALQSCL